MLDRSKLKATATGTLKSQEQEVGELIRKASDRPGWLSIEKGSNKFRIFPAHPGSESFIYPRCTVWLEKSVTYNKDGKDVTEVQRRPVFNSKVHGGTKKDLVEEYVTFATKLLQEEIDAEQGTEAKALLNQKLTLLTHWQNGIKYKTGWCCYANKIVDGKKEFGQVEFTSGMKEKLNELMVTEDVNSPIETDPFTDVDDGKAILISKTLEKNKKSGREETKYAVNIEFRGNYALTDEEVEAFEKVEPLSKIYKNSFKMRDFQIQLEGLQFFDKKNKIGVLDFDSFIDIIEEIKGYYPEETPEVDDEVEEEEGDDNNTSNAVDNETDEFHKMDRTNLKQWIASNCPNKEVIVRKDDSDEDIRNKIRDYINISEDFVKDEVEDIEEEEETPKPVLKKSTKSSVSADVKKQLGLK